MTAQGARNLVVAAEQAGERAIELVAAGAPDLAQMHAQTAAHIARQVLRLKRNVGFARTDRDRVMPCVRCLDIAAGTVRS